MIYGIGIIIVLFIFLIGYSLGRRVGKDEGYALGLSYSSLKLREEMNKRVNCPICNKLY